MIWLSSVVSVVLFLILTLCRQTDASAVAAVLSRGGDRFQRKTASTNTFVKTILDARRHLVAAAIARSTSIFAMYPVDTIKTRIQMDQSSVFRLQGLYKGIIGSLIGQCPYGVLTFGSYEMYKQSLLKRFPNVTPAYIYASSAILGDLTGSGWLCPSEVIKQQVQAGLYSSTTEAFRGILKKQGITGLYQGYFGGLTRDLPFRVAQLTTYEVTKNIYLRVKANRSAKAASAIELSAGEAAVCGAISGTVSAAITAPLDRIKTLLMTDAAAYGGSVVSCASHIFANEGLKGFTTGILPRVVYIAPSVVVFFITYEKAQQKLKHWKT